MPVNTADLLDLYTLMCRSVSLNPRLLPTSSFAESLPFASRLKVLPTMFASPDWKLYGHNNGIIMPFQELKQPLILQFFGATSRLAGSFIGTSSHLVAFMESLVHSLCEFP